MVATGIYALLVGHWFVYVAIFLVFVFKFLIMLYNPCVKIALSFWLFASGKNAFEHTFIPASTWEPGETVRGRNYRNKARYMAV